MCLLFIFECSAKNSEVDKALGLWTQMQEEDVNIPDDFLIVLGKLLKQNDRPVPFDMTNLVQKEEKFGKSI